jgi:ElaB/YqjD/DUF883 family membrane-anchored ribosome-binding protein
MKTTDKVSKSVHETFDKIADAGNQAAEALGEKGQKLKNTEQKLMENCRSYVHDNPITSLGIAVVAGFLLSRVLSGR